ncbi:multicopper oxidase-domain-containing protein [Zopfochytrium polystomum]|nr:multicopper oxidase-domain-containing protein [Zopfochytrium polystomum]
MSFKALALAATFVSTALLQARSTSAACANSPTARNCWGNYDVTTDYYDTVPNTGVTRTYYLALNNVTMAPDGVSRYVTAFNSSIPGPTITADWGDTVVVHVTNNLSNNGTALHWHGLRQNYTAASDGVPGVTQCAIAPGDTFKYTWRATQYGTTWYHSHFSLQYGNGAFGAIVINGPATANYDEDLGPLLIQDWAHSDAFYLFSINTGAPPGADNGLINGTNKYNSAGSYFSATVTSGKTYRLRVVNSGVYAHMKFSIDNHSFQVIAADLVPIVPYNTTVLDVALGQRYDITASNYWIRAIPQLSCTNNKNQNGIKGILRYSTAANLSADPTTTAFSYTDSCGDQTMSLTPKVTKTIAASAVTASGSLPVAFSQQKWYINGKTQVIDWANPSLGMVEAQNTSYPSAFNVISLNGTSSDWAFFFFNAYAKTYENTAPPSPSTTPCTSTAMTGGSSPAAPGTFTGKFTDYLTAAVPRRDVVVLPAAGYLAVAFPLDNPGTWLMHCHIAFHASEGLSLQFVERHADIRGSVGVDGAWNQTCTNWSAYVKGKTGLKVLAEMDDSGI